MLKWEKTQRMESQIMVDHVPLAMCFSGGDNVTADNETECERPLALLAYNTNEYWVPGANELTIKFGCDELWFEWRRWFVAMYTSKLKCCRRPPSSPGIHSTNNVLIEWFVMAQLRTGSGRPIYVR